MPAPPYSCGTEHAEQAELRHLRKDLRVEAVLAIELPDARRHLARAPFAHRLLEQPLFFRKIEIHISDVPEMRSELDCIARLSGQEVRTSTISLTPDLLSDRSPPLFMPLESRAARALGFANRHVHEQNPKPCDDHADTQEARKHQAASRRREVVPDQVQVPQRSSTARPTSSAGDFARRHRGSQRAQDRRSREAATLPGRARRRPRAAMKALQRRASRRIAARHSSVSKIRHVAAPGDGKGFPFASVVPPLWTSLQKTTNWVGRTMSTQFAGRRSGS